MQTKHSKQSKIYTAMTNWESNYNIHIIYVDVSYLEPGQGGCSGKQGVEDHLPEAKVIEVCKLVRHITHICFVACSCDGYKQELNNHARHCAQDKKEIEVMPELSPVFQTRHLP